MPDNVVVLPVTTYLPVPVERVLEGALENHGDRPFKRVMVIGVCEDGEEYFASSDNDGGAMLWSLERARHKLMTIADEGDN